MTNQEIKKHFSRSRHSEEYEIISIETALMLFRDDPRSLLIWIAPYGKPEEIGYDNCLSTPFMREGAVFVTLKED